MWKYIALLGQIGLIIAIPIVVLTLVGRYLDNRFDTSPWFLLSSVIVAFIVSSGILYIQVFRSIRIMEQEDKKTDGDDDEDDIMEDIGDFDDE